MLTKSAALLAFVSLFSLGAAAQRAADPEGLSVKIAKPEAVARHYMAVAAHPLAAKAGADMLAAGGSAADAAIAAQLVLTLVEPQSSGIGGGGFLTYFDRKTGKVTVYDGRETAPAADGPNLFIGPDGQPLGFRDAAIGGKPVGVPGIMRLLEILHKDHGKLPWAKLFEPAIKLSADGFPTTERMHWWLDTAKDFLSSSPSLRARFYNADGTPPAVGQPYKNPELAATFRLLADKGADAFYTGPLAQQIVDAVHQGMAIADRPSPGALSLDDLKNYKVVKRDAVCGAYEKYEICGAGPPSSGTIAVLETLGMLRKFDLKKLGPNNPQSLHIVAEASRRAFADRDAYVGDPAFVEVPVKGLLDPAYVASRADTIDPAKVASMKIDAGTPPGRHAGLGVSDNRETAGTSHLSVVDTVGNGVSFTTTVNAPFGAHLMAGGFVLNDQLTDFNLRPSPDGKPVPNSVAPGKRPRSSMAPLIVFDDKHRMRLLIGSPGGSKIIDYVVWATLAHLDWGVPIQKAVDMGHIVNTGSRTELEADTPAAGFADALKAMGHQVEVMSQTSGLHAIAIMPDGLHGGADWRREGVALGD